MTSNDRVSGFTARQVTRPRAQVEEQIREAVAKTTVRRHIDIVRALESGGPDEAAQAMEAHLAYVLRYSSDLSGEGIS